MSIEQAIGSINRERHIFHRTRAKNQVQLLLARFRQWNGGLDSLYGREDRRKCVEYCKKSVHAPILENATPPPGV